MDKQLQSMLDRTYTTLKKAGKSDAEIESATRELYDMYQSGAFTAKEQGGQALPLDEQILPDIPFFPDTLVRGVAKPLLKATGAVSRAGVGLIGGAAAVAGQEDLSKKIFEAADQPIDYGYFGKISPMGSSFDVGRAPWAKQNVAALADIVSTDLELISYAFNPLKIPAAGGTLKTIFNPANLKAVAPFAAPFSVGLGLQKTGEELQKGESGTKAVVKGIEEAAISYGGAVAGFSLLNGGGTFLANWGGRAMRKPIVKALAEKMGDFASQARNFVQSGGRQRLGQTLDYARANYEKQVNDTMIGLTDSLMDEFSPQVPDGNKMFDHIKTVMKQFISSAYKTRDALFDRFLDTPGVVVDDLTNLTRVEEKAKNWLNGMIKAGRSEDEAVSLVQNFLAKIKRDKPLNLREAYRSATEYGNYLGKNEEANTLVRELFFSSLDDMESSIAKSDKPELLVMWKEAKDFAKNLSQNIDTDFAGKLTNAAKVNNMVDSMLSGKTPQREEMKALREAFKDPQDRKILSQFFVNSIFDKAKMQNTPAGRAAVIDKAVKWLQEFGDEGIVEVGHLDQLTQMQNLLGTKFSNFITNAQRIGQGGGDQFIPQVEQLAEKQASLNFINNMAAKTNNFRDYSKLGDAIKNIDSTENLNSVLSLLGDDKELIGVVGKEILRGIAERNSRITQGAGEIGEDAIRKQVSGIFNDINNIGGSNKEEIFRNLFGDTEVKFGDGETMKLSDYLIKTGQELEALGSIENMSGETLLKAAHLTVGLLYGFSGRMVPATYHLSQFVNATKSSTKTEILNTLLESLKQDNKISDNLRRRLGEKIKKATAETYIPTRVTGFTLDQIYKGAAEMLGVDELSDEDKAGLSKEWQDSGL